jgi:hypothetical protein
VTTLFNGSPGVAPAVSTQVQLEKQAAAMKTRLQALQVLAAGIDSQAVPDAATIATGLTAEIAILATWGVTPSNPVP